MRVFNGMIWFVFAISLCDDGRCLNVHAAEPLRVLRIDDKYAEAIEDAMGFAVSADGQRMAISQPDNNRATVFDLRTVTPIAEIGLAEPASVTIDRTGANVVVLCKVQLGIWNVDERTFGMLPARFERGFGRYSELGYPRFRNDGRSVVVPFSPSDDSPVDHLAIIDSASRRITTDIGVGGDAGFDRRISALDISADGRWGVIGDYTGGLAVWNLETGKLHQTLLRGYMERDESREVPRTWNGGSPEVISFVAFVSGLDQVVAYRHSSLTDAGKVVANQESVQVWKYESRTARWLAGQRMSVEDAGEFRCSEHMAIVGRGRFLAMVSKAKVGGALIDLSTGRMDFRFGLPADKVKFVGGAGNDFLRPPDVFKGVAVSSDGRKLWTVSTGGKFAEFEVPE